MPNFKNVIIHTVEILTKNKNVTNSTVRILTEPVALRRRFREVEEMSFRRILIAESREITLQIVKLSLHQLNDYYNALDTRIQNWNNDKWHNSAMTFAGNVIIRISQISTSERTRKCH